MQAERQSCYASPSLFSPLFSAVNRSRAGVSAALLFLLSSTAPVHPDAAGTESPGGDTGASRCDAECPPPAETGPEVGDADWDEIKRKSREAIEAWTEGARTAARATWERTNETWAASEEASGETVEEVRDGSAATLDSTRQDAEQVWKEAREESKELWRKARPKVAEAVAGAARGGERAWDAARQAGHVFWQTLTAEDAGEE